MVPERVRSYPAHMLVRALPLGLVLAAWAVMVLVPAAHHSSVTIPSWFLMVIAMMVPTVLRPMRKVAHGDALRAAIFLLAYCGVWMVAAVPVALVPLASIPGVALGVLWILAGGIQLLPSTERSLHACRRLHPSDSPWTAGFLQGIWCVRACLVLMVATVAAAGSMPTLAGVGLMLVVTAIMLWEKSRRATSAGLRFTGLALIAVGVLIAMLAPGAHLHG